MKPTLTLAHQAGLNDPVCPECKTAHKTGEVCSDALCDGDAATTSNLLAFRRSRLYVADVEVRYRADLVTKYVAARSTGNTDVAIGIVLDAMELDAARPGEPRLMDEIRAYETPSAVA